MADIRVKDLTEASVPGADYYLLTDSATDGVKKVLTTNVVVPVASGVSGLGTGVAAFLATPSSANLASALTDETGSGAAVFATSPTLVTPTLGAAAAISINKVAVTAPATSATLTIADGKTLTASGDATVSGTNTGDQTITLTGDVTGTGTGSFAATIGATKVVSAMLNADVFSTAHSWSGQQTFVAPVLGTPASGVATNLTGTASGLTAGNVTTNANLTGDVTSVGNATTIGATKVTSAMLNADVFSTAHSWSGVQTFTNPVVGTQSPGDNSTKAASTAFVQDAITSSGGGDLLSTNNLSDVADADAALTNLGITSIGKAVGTAPDAGSAVRALGLDAEETLIDKFRGGTVSAELFTLPNGVNEFDLIKVGGTFYFAYDDKTTTQLRSASTVAGLSSASDATPVADLRYPSIQFDGATWHLWGQNNTTGVISHYTASSFTGTYTLSDSMPSQFGDVGVRKFSNGKWYMGCLDGRDATRPAIAFVADSPNGPWTSLGQIFKDIGRGPPHAGEEDDESIFEVDGKVYLGFGAFDGIDSSKGQLPAICELDPHTLRAKTQPVVLVNATASWQQRNSKLKLYNPIFLREGGGVPDRIYYSHNVSTTGVAAGWGYIEVGSPPADNRRDLQSVNIDFRNANFDVATGLIPTLHGATTVNSSGLTLTSTTGGVYGFPNIPALDDFAICVDLTLSSLPASSSFYRVFRLAKRTEDANLISIWVSTSSGGVTKIFSQVGATSATWTTVLTTGVQYRVVVTRQNNAVLGYINGKDEYSATISGTQTVQEFSIGNAKGVTNAAAQQFVGTIRKVVLVSGKLFDTDFSS